MRARGLAVAVVLGGLLLGGCSSASDEGVVQVATTVAPGEWTAPPEIVREDGQARGFDSDAARKYVVVVNDDDQYSIWLADRQIPLGWRAAGFDGTREACLSWISEQWIR